MIRPNLAFGIEPFRGRVYSSTRRRQQPGGAPDDDDKGARRRAERDAAPLPRPHRTARRPGPRPDRKSVVQGKSVSVRVDLGGRRILKKKKKSTISTDKHL